MCSEKIHKDSIRIHLLCFNSRPMSCKYLPNLDDNVIHSIFGKSTSITFATSLTINIFYDWLLHYKHLHVLDINASIHSHKLMYVNASLG